MPRASNRALCCLLSLAVAGVLLVPQEHVHPADISDGQHPSVVHHHFAPHQSAPEHDAGLDHPDGDPQWLPRLLAGPERAPRIAPGKQIHFHATVQVTLGRPASVAAVLLTDVSIHDPPLIDSHGLRGPPFSSL